MLPLIFIFIVYSLICSVDGFGVHIDFSVIKSFNPSFSFDNNDVRTALNTNT